MAKGKTILRMALWDDECINFVRFWKQVKDGSIKTQDGFELEAIDPQHDLWAIDPYTDVADIAEILPQSEISIKVKKAGIQATVTQNVNTLAIESDEDVNALREVVTLVRSGIRRVDPRKGHVLDQSGKLVSLSSFPRWSDISSHPNNSTVRSTLETMFKVGPVGGRGLSILVSGPRYSGKTAMVIDAMLGASDTAGTTGILFDSAGDPLATAVCLAKRLAPSVLMVDDLLTLDKTERDLLARIMSSPPADVIVVTTCDEMDSDCAPAHDIDLKTQAVDWGSKQYDAAREELAKSIMEMCSFENVSNSIVKDVARALKEADNVRTAIGAAKLAAITATTERDVEDQVRFALGLGSGSTKVAINLDGAMKKLLMEGVTQGTAKTIVAMAAGLPSTASDETVLVFSLPREGSEEMEAYLRSRKSIANIRSIIDSMRGADVEMNKIKAALSILNVPGTTLGEIAAILSD